jgi:hypothetical protein
MKTNNNPEPRQQMIIDLQNSIQQLTAKNYEIILMWDANERIDHPKSKINQFMANTNLAPLHHTLPQASYVRGTTCIDYIMATPVITQCHHRYRILSLLRRNMAF